MDVPGTEGGEGGGGLAGKGGAGEGERARHSQVLAGEVVNRARMPGRPRSRHPAAVMRACPAGLGLLDSGCSFFWAAVSELCQCSESQKGQKQQQQKKQKKKQAEKKGKVQGSMLPSEDSQVDKLRRASPISGHEAVRHSHPADGWRLEGCARKGRGTSLSSRIE